MRKKPYQFPLGTTPKVAKGVNESKSEFPNIVSTQIKIGDKDYTLHYIPTSDERFEMIKGRERMILEQKALEYITSGVPLPSDFNSLDGIKIVGDEKRLDEDIAMWRNAAKENEEELHHAMFDSIMPVISITDKADSEPNAERSVATDADKRTKSRKPKKEKE